MAFFLTVRTIFDRLSIFKRINPTKSEPFVYSSIISIVNFSRAFGTNRFFILVAR